METAIEINRTPDVIAAEINSIKNQTRTMILNNSIEIGRRLSEAKSLLSHGEWGPWLEKSVEYSQSTANNLMRIYDEYGSDQFALFGDHPAKSQVLANLSYTQAVALLGVPAEEREEFIQENDIENMSTRELQQAIKEKVDLEAKLKDALEEAKNISESYDRLEEANKKHFEESQRLSKELNEIKEQLATAQNSGNDDEVQRLQESLDKKSEELGKSKQQIKELTKQLNDKPIDVPAAVEKVPDELQAELDTLRKNKDNVAAVQKYTVYFDVLVKGFKDLLGSLDGIQDPEVREQYKGAVVRLLDKMGEALK
jgi:DNA repair exonuclease SbcCD ATPase subunit